MIARFDSGRDTPEGMAKQVSVPSGVVLSERYQRDIFWNFGVKFPFPRKKKNRKKIIFVYIKLIIKKKNARFPVIMKLEKNSFSDLGC